MCVEFEQVKLVILCEYLCTTILHKNTIIATKINLIMRLLI